MMRPGQRKSGKVLAVATVLALLILIGGGFFISTREPARRRVSPGISPSDTAVPAAVTREIEEIPFEEWTSRFTSLQQRGLWNQLMGDLDWIAENRAAQYKAYSLGYLHARASFEAGDDDEAADLFEPYLKDGNPFRDLALYYRAEIAAGDDPALASRLRDELIEDYPESLYRSEAIENQLEWLSAESDLEGLRRLYGSIREAAPTSLRRDMESRIVETALAREANIDILTDGVQLLRGSTADDAAERIFRVFDEPEILESLRPQSLALVGFTAQSHRHYDRAVEILSSVLPRLPANSDDLLFAIGRSQFGAENYAEAEQTYLRGARSTKQAEPKATFLFHASRAAQLLENDERAERLMTEAIAVPGRFGATSAALTQRTRTRLHQKRFAEAQSDLAQLKWLFPDSHGFVEASIAVATAQIANDRFSAAVRTLDAIPRNLLDSYDPSEIAYWKARALEQSDPPAAFELYLDVLRATVPTHFAYFARHRLQEPPLSERASAEVSRRSSEVAELIEASEMERARDAQTDVVLLAPAGQQAVHLETLRSIYEELPSYREILDLAPEPFHSLPGVDRDSRLELLLAMGLFDDAIDGITDRYPLRPAASAVTRALALNRGGASRASIYAAEVLMNGVPADYVPALLPPVVRGLLYPRYFYDFIERDSERYGAEPRLVLSIMREESRFNPRAKSAAAARGLLQFIITTARQVGQELGLLELSSEDLYDPRIIIQLGAKYVASLLEQFDGNAYRAAASYNAGPNQVRLWSRLAPAPGDDYFLSAINFTETKHYVRKVLNSYERYGELYDHAGPVGGTKAEP